jgi:uncharacterized membrane protein
MGEGEGVTFTAVMEHAAQAFEAAGVLVLVVGLVWSLVLAVSVWRRDRDGHAGYAALRRAFGAVLLLGLEILVAADLIRTVAVTPTLESVGVLGLIVLIRTFLSFSLEIEIEGTPPWRRAARSGATRVAQAARAYGQGGAGPADGPGRDGENGRG